MTAGAAKAAADSYDVVIVGGGPAGLTAGIWLARYLHSVLLVDSGDPRNWETRGIHGFLGHEGVRPAALRGLGRDTCRGYGVELLDAAVARVERLERECFRVALETGTAVTTRRLLLAIGIRDVWPDAPGLERCYGATAHVCPDCDGYEARGKKTVVIGSGRKAVGMALALTTWTREIVVVTNGAPAEMTAAWMRKLDALEIPVLESRIRRVASAGGALRGLELEDDMMLDCEQIFFALGQGPADDLAAQLGCRRDEIGRVVADAHMHTSVEYVYAAGDIVHEPQIAILAAGTGAVAALAIHHSLVPPERQLD